MPKTAALDPATIFSQIDFRGEQVVVAAVSGGGDSLALLFLLKDYLAGIGHAPELIAVTVDHGLRPESAGEAEMVARLCHVHGIEHQTLRWEGEKPKTGIAAAAREARYRLLIEAARDAGARIILTGHTRDDQIETFLMRQLRGEGRGLAGMAAETLLDGNIWLLRPLLVTRRQDLRAFLAKRKIEWFDDPTNENPAFERPRVRAGLDGAETDATLEAIAVAAAMRRELGDAAADFLANDGVRIEPGDVADIDVEWLKGARHDVALLAIVVLASVIGGRSFLAGEAERERILGHLLSEKGPVKLALGRTIIKRGKHRHHIWREARGLPELVLASGESGIWDGRYRIVNHLTGEALVRVASPSTAELDDFCLNSGIEPTDFHRAAALTGPAVTVDGRLVDMPALTGGRFLPAGLEITRHIALFDKILPGHDLALANAVRRLFGFPNYPEPPLQNARISNAL